MDTATIIVLGFMLLAIVTLGFVTIMHLEMHKKEFRFSDYEKEPICDKYGNVIGMALIKKES